MVPNKRADGSLKQHPGNWGVYAAAAGAALAMSTNASAGLIYSGTLDVTLSVTPNAGLLDKQFTVAGYQKFLVLANFTSVGPEYGLAGVADRSTANLRFLGARSNYGNLFGRNYHLGQAINGADATFSAPGADLRREFGVGGNYQTGAWGPGTVTGFLGFKIKSGALAGDLGWLEVKVSDAGSPGYPNEAEVIAWAYDNSGAAILAGDTPEPGTAALGLLAIGAAGILAFRRRRNALAAKS